MQVNKFFYDFKQLYINKYDLQNLYEQKHFVYLVH